ncbi:MAG: glycosyltransferase family 4 protein [Pyrinomonadaceae bacterium]
MRILYISSARVFGGGERHVVDLAREMTERGHQVFVALRPTNEWQSRFDFLPAERFLHVSIRNSFGMFSAKQIARFVERNNIKIIHAHVARDYIAASVAARSAKKTRLVLTRHVMFPMKSYHRFALGNVDAAIAVSAPVATHLERVFPRNKIHVIPNGIHVSETGRDTASAAEFRQFHNIAHDAPLIVTLGELKLLKGQRDFVLAANEIAKTHREAHFIIAGRDNTLDKKFRRELKRLVHVFGLDDKFTWLDWLDNIEPLLAAADIFVSPSHSESFGLAILDAMAAGTPVIATATDGAKELIADAEALVPVKDPLALAAAVRTYLDDSEKRRKLADSLRTTAREKFSLTRMGDATEAIYRKLAGQ